MVNTFKARYFYSSPRPKVQLVGTEPNVCGLHSCLCYPNSTSLILLFETLHLIETICEDEEQVQFCQEQHTSSKEKKALKEKGR